jgi:hypothetical protein
MRRMGKLCPAPETGRVRAYNLLENKKKIACFSAV